MRLLGISGSAIHTLLIRGCPGSSLGASSGPADPEPMDPPGLVIRLY